MQYDKRTLYQSIENKLCEYGLNDPLPLDILSMVKRETVEIHYYPFESNSIGAVLYKDNHSGILVNKNKPLFDQRFDIAHELIHYWFHSNFTSFSFNNLENRDKEKEWQANEGAAELLLPYKHFIPQFINTAGYAEENYEPLESIYDTLARHYQVSTVVIDYRIRNLENEIMQYFKGTPIDDISLTRTSVKLIKDKPPVFYKTFVNKFVNRNA